MSNVYDITYVLGDDESVSKADNTANATTYTVEDTITLATPTRDGYTFLGWYDNANFEGNAVTEFSDDIGDKTFYAKWEVIVFNITYVMNDGNSVSSATNPNTKTTYTVEESLTLEDATRKGYTFKGWKENGEATTGFEAGTIGDKTYTANWEIIVYTITYQKNDANSASPATNPNTKTTYTVEESFTLQNATRVGYTFKGWTENGTLTTGFNAGTIGNKTYKANWEIINYKITFILNGKKYDGKENRSTYTIEDNQINLVLRNYSLELFSGWFKDSNLKERATFIPAHSTGDVTFYGIVTPNYPLLSMIEKSKAESNAVKTEDKPSAEFPADETPVDETPVDKTPAEATLMVSEWAADEVNAAVDAGLVPEDILGLNLTGGITRGELAKLVKVLVAKVYGKDADGEDIEFTDCDDADILYMAKLGIFNGYKTENGYEFKAENKLKRSEITAVLNRVAKLCGINTEGYDDDVKFEDVIGHWCYSELGWAVHNEIIKGTTEKTFAPENTLTREQSIALVLRAFNTINAETAE